MSHQNSPKLAERALSKALNLVGRAGMGRPAADFLLALLSRREAPRIQRAFEGYQPTAGDVIVSTFPKSGTNWMLQMAVQTAWKGRAEFEHIHELVPWPDRPLSALGAPLHAPIDRPSPTGLRIVKSHLAQQHIPWTPEARYIVVVRDPKDVFVSLYHFGLGLLTSMIDVDYSLDEWLELHLGGGLSVFGSWAEHTASWWQLRDRPNVLIMHYGAMKRDLEGSVRQVVDHLGVSLTEEELAAVVERSGFKHMKAHNHQFEPQVTSLRGEKPAMVRSGVAGGHSKLLDEAQRRRLDEDSRAELIRLGSDFPFDELYGRVAVAA